MSAVRRRLRSKTSVSPVVNGLMGPATEQLKPGLVADDGPLFIGRPGDLGNADDKKVSVYLALHIHCSCGPCGFASLWPYGLWAFFLWALGPSHLLLSWSLWPCIPLALWPFGLSSLVPSALHRCCSCCPCGLASLWP